MIAAVETELVNWKITNKRQQNKKESLCLWYDNGEMGAVRMDNTTAVGAVSRRFDCDGGAVPVHVDALLGHGSRPGAASAEEALGMRR